MIGALTKSIFGAVKAGAKTLPGNIKAFGNLGKGYSIIGQVGKTAAGLVKPLAKGGRRVATRNIDKATLDGIKSSTISRTIKNSLTKAATGTKGSKVGLRFGSKKTFAGVVGAAGAAGGMHGFIQATDERTQVLQQRKRMKHNHLGTDGLTLSLHKGRHR